MAKNNHHFSAKQFAQTKSKEIKSLPFKNILIASLVTNIVCLVFVFIAQHRLPPEIPLYYGLPRGEGQLSTSMGLIIPPAISLGIILINTLFASFTKNNYLQKVLVFSASTTVIFATVTVVKIVFLVGNL